MTKGLSSRQRATIGSQDMKQSVRVVREEAPDSGLFPEKHPQSFGIHTRSTKDKTKIEWCMANIKLTVYEGTIRKLSA